MSEPTPIAFPRDIPFIKMLGIELLQFGGGQAQLRLAPGPEHGNSFGVVHGGALMTLLDVTMAHAARSAEPEDMGCITIEMKTSFMRGAQGPIVCTGKLMHRTRSMAFVEATIQDASGQACCHATGTFKVLKAKDRAPLVGSD